MDAPIVAASVSAAVTAVVTSVVGYFAARLNADKWLSTKFGQLIDDLRKRVEVVEAENRECQEKYRELSELISVITPAE